MEAERTTNKGIMKQSQREQLARDIFDKGLSLGLNFEMDGEWVVISPANKCPIEITLAANQCAGELAHIVGQIENECS